MSLCIDCPGFQDSDRRGQRESEKSLDCYFPMFLILRIVVSTCTSCEGYVYIRNPVPCANTKMYPASLSTPRFFGLYRFTAALSLVPDELVSITWLSTSMIGKKKIGLEKDRKDTAGDLPSARLYVRLPPFHNFNLIRVARTV